MPNATIELEKPITGHEGEIRKIVLREPTYREVMPNGSPYQVHDTDDGQSVVLYDNEKIRAYAEACLIEPKESDLLKQLGLRDTMKLREAVLRFFLPPASADAGSATSQKSSGSTAASPPTPSAA